MPYPSIITIFPFPAPTDRLNSPSHSALHNLESSTISQIETFVGLTGDSSTIGTLVYDVRSPDSNGGGHIQTANKGGTGQTTYTKGDLLVATSQSVLSKLSVGIDGQAIVANSSLAAGMGWATPGGVKIANSASVQTVISAPEVSILSVNVPGSTLGINGAIIGRVYVNNMKFPANSSVLTKAIYGGAVVGSIMLTAVGALAGSVNGILEYTLLANAATNQQRGIFRADLKGQTVNVGGITSVINEYNMNIASINSLAPQNFGITIKLSQADGSDSIVIDGYTFQKII